MLFLSITAVATPINGSFHFGGMFEINDNHLNNQKPDFTKADTFWYKEAQWNGQTGDYVGIGYGPSDYGVHMRLSDVRIPNFWGTYLVDSSYQIRNVSFDITSIEFTITSTSFLAQGTGIAYMTGFDPTIATWQTTSTSYSEFINYWFAGTTVTVTGVPASVPDTGITVVMLGVALVGLGCLSRKFSLV